MLIASQEAASAARSAAEAAWWSLLLNGLAAAGAVGALWYAVLQGARAGSLDRLRIGALCHAIETEILSMSALYHREHSAKENGQSVIDSGVLGRLRKHLEIASNQIIPHAAAQTSVGYLLLLLDLLEADIKAGGDGSFQLAEAEETAKIFAVLGYKYLGRQHPEPWLKDKFVPSRIHPLKAFAQLWTRWTRLLFSKRPNGAPAEEKA